MASAFAWRQAPDQGFRVLPAARATLAFDRERRIWQNQPIVADANDIAGRLRRLEDLEEIRQLFVDYGHHLDAGDVEAYAALFSDDGELLLGPIGRAKGREAIVALMTRVRAGAATQSFHLVTNPIIRLDGDHATSEVLWTVIRPDADGTLAVAMFGRHHDELVRERGRWRIRSRRGQIDVPASFRR